MSHLHKRISFGAFAVGFFLSSWAQSFQEAGAGLARREDRIASEPWAIQIVRIERGRNDLAWLPTLGGGDRIGLNTLTGQLGLIPRSLGMPVAAINGDFYETDGETFPGDPRGLFIARGELVSAPAARDCFWFDRQGEPHIGRVASGLQVVWPDGTVTALGLNEDLSGQDAVLLTPAAGDSRVGRGSRIVLERVGDGPWLPLRVGETYRAQAARDPLSPAPKLTLAVSSQLRGQATRLKAGGVVEISTRLTPDLTGVSTAIGGGPALVHEGKALAVRVTKSNERHPRSALGWNEKFFFLVVVDGRQPDFSDGMTLPELAAYLVSLGCVEAMNLDGGASTELWLRGRILNRPCHGQERDTGTSLVVLRKPAATNSVVNPK